MTAPLKLFKTNPAPETNKSDWYRKRTGSYLPLRLQLDYAAAMAKREYVWEAYPFARWKQNTGDKS